MTASVEANCSGDTQSTSGSSGSMAVSAGSRLILMHVQADGVGQPTLTFKWNTTESLIEFVDYDPQTPWGTGSIFMYYLDNPTAGTYSIAYTNAGPFPRGHFVCSSVTGIGHYPGCIRDEGGNNLSNVTTISGSVAGAEATDIGFYIGGKDDTSQSTNPTGGANEILDVAIVDGRASAGWLVGLTSLGFYDTAPCNRSVYAVALREPEAGNRMILMMSSLYDKVNENRKKMGVSDLGNFGLKGGLMLPKERLATI